MRYPGFINGSYASASNMAAIERTLNLYVEPMESAGASVDAALYPFPGTVQFGPTPAENPVRGLFYEDIESRMFSVAGATLREIFANETAITRGTVGNDNGTVTFAFNGPNGGQVMMSSAGLGYLYTLATNVLTQPVNDVDFVDFLDGFFLGLDVSTSSLKISNLLDGAVWNAAQIAQRNLASDQWVSMMVNAPDIWLFGTRTTEVWQNTGAAPYPFGPIPGAFMQEGIAAPHSVAKVNKSLMWLARNEQGAGVVRRSEGWTAQRVSNYALEYAIQNYGTINDAIGWSFEYFGHEFYVLEFPTEGHTWCYDARTGLWVELSSRDVTNGLDLAWRPRYHVWGFDKHIVGDSKTGRLFHLTGNSAVDVDGQLIRRQRRAPHVQSELNDVRFEQFRLNLQTGIGLATGQGENPTVMLRYSDDGGQTWSPEFWRSAGAIGRYDAIVQWTALGTGRRRVFEVTFTDPVAWRILDAYLKVQVYKN